jgi:hypothetical protein
MSSEGEKCLEILLLDSFNYGSWCISILHNIEAFNPYLLSIVDARISRIHNEKFSESTIVQDSSEADCLTKPVRPVGHTS